MSRDTSPFEYGGQWLDRVDGSPYWYRFRYDKKRRRTCKSSLGTSDLEEAKGLIVRAVTTTPQSARSPDVVQMLVVEAAYLEHQLHDRPRTLIEARRAFRTVNAFMEARSRHHKAWRVAEFDLLEQREYMRRMAERGLSPKSISTALSFVGAAVNWAARDQVVRDGRQERQIRILAHPITVDTSVTRIAEIVDAEIDDTPRWIPQPADLARFIDAIDENTLECAGVGGAAAEMVFRFTVVALNTWARREAVTDLRKNSVDYAMGLVNLNPPGRRQTRKRRPIVRLTDNLRAWLLAWNEDQPIRWYRRDRSDLWDGFRAVAAAAGTPKLTPHVLRHFMNSRAIALGVPAEERSMWLGHLDRAKAPTTEIYEHATPEFLEKARAATDCILAEIEGMTRRRRLNSGIVQSCENGNAPSPLNYPAGFSAPQRRARPPKAAPDSPSR